MRRVAGPSDRIVVVGAGCSALVHELAVGDHDGGSDTARIVAVDISASALHKLVEALGQSSRWVECVVGDVCELVLVEQVQVWHDRATFHFLTDPVQQRAYAARVAAAVAPGGHFVLAGFAPDGPEQCSGLDVVRHSVGSLTELFGDDFELVESFEREHVTPWNSPQRFLHAVFRRRSTG